MLVSTLLGSLSGNIYLTIGIYSVKTIVRHNEGPTSRLVLFAAASISKKDMNPIVTLLYEKRIDRVVLYSFIFEQVFYYFVPKCSLPFQYYTVLGNTTPNTIKH